MIEIADILEASIPGARRETIPGAAHHLQMERPPRLDAGTTREPHFRTGISRLT